MSTERYCGRIDTVFRSVDERIICIATLLCRTDTACNHKYEPTTAPLCLGRSSLSDIIVNSLCFIFRLYKVDSPAECLAPGGDQRIA